MASSSSLFQALIISYMVSLSGSLKPILHAAIRVSHLCSIENSSLPPPPPQYLQDKKPEPCHRSPMHSPTMTCLCFLFHVPSLLSPELFSSFAFCQACSLAHPLKLSFGIPSSKKFPNISQARFVPPSSDPTLLHAHLY